MRPFVVLLISWHSLSRLCREGFVVHPRISLTFFLPSSSNGRPGPFGPLHWWQPRHLRPLAGDTPSVYRNTLWANLNKWVSLPLLLFLSSCLADVFLSGRQCFTWSWSRASCFRLKNLAASFLSRDCWCSLAASSISVQLSNEEFAVLLSLAEYHSKDQLAAS